MRTLNFIEKKFQKINERTIYRNKHLTFRSLSFKINPSDCPFSQYQPKIKLKGSSCHRSYAFGKRQKLLEQYYIDSAIFQVNELSRLLV